MYSGTAPSGVVVSLSVVILWVMTIVFLVVVPSSVGKVKDDEWWRGQPLVVSGRRGGVGFDVCACVCVCVCVCS